MTRRSARRCAANSVEITRTADGIIVRGLAGTTINGAAGQFVAVAGQATLPGDLHIDLGSERTDRGILGASERRSRVRQNHRIT